MTRSMLALAAAALVSAAAVACGAAPESGNNKLPTCDPDTEDCAKSNSHKPSTGTPSTSESDITQTADPASPAPGASHDAGADAAPSADAGPDAAKTTFCQDLMTCCGELATQGYDNTLCKGIVAKNDQAQCLQKLASYQSFGDCS